MSTFTLIAKAGGASEASENTLSAIEAALAVPAPPGVELAVEIDVRLSADGVPVAIHDARLERTTNGRGLVRAHAVRALRELRAGSADEPIPLLEEVLALCRARQHVLDLHERDDRSAALVLATLGRADANVLSRVIVASEHGAVIDTLRRAEPRIRSAATKHEAYRQLLCSWLGWQRLAPRGHTWIVPACHRGVEVVTPRFVSSARRFGDDVWVYVVDTPGELRRLRALGVSGCFTTRPSALVREFCASA